MACVTPTIDCRLRPVRSRPAFTLAESLIASVVLAVAVVGISGMLSAAYQQAGAMQQSAMSMTLARQLMEEIAARPYADPTTGAITLGPPTGRTSRSQFLDVGDYHGYTDTGSPLTLLGGQTVTVGDGQTYTRKVTVEYRSTPSGSSVSSGDFALVTVTVTNQRSQAIKLQRLMTNVSWQF